MPPLENTRAEKISQFRRMQKTRRRLEERQQQLADFQAELRRKEVLGEAPGWLKEPEFMTAADRRELNQWARKSAKTAWGDPSALAEMRARARAAEEGREYSDAFLTTADKVFLAVGLVAGVALVTRWLIRRQREKRRQQLAASPPWLPGGSVSE